MSSGICTVLNSFRAFFSGLGFEGVKALTRLETADAEGVRQHTPSIRQHTFEGVTTLTRQHTSAYVSAYLQMRCCRSKSDHSTSFLCLQSTLAAEASASSSSCSRPQSHLRRRHTSAYVSICQLRQHTCRGDRSPQVSLFVLMY